MPLLQNPVTGIPIIAIVTFLLNLPLGYLRAGTRSFAMKMIYIHAAVPIVIVLRMASGLGPPWALIPLFIAVAIAGQFAGGRLRPRTSTPAAAATEPAEAAPKQ